jgi:acyl-CoA thioester hydrolase
MPTIYTTTVRPEWIDYNGHMNSGYYNVVIDNAVGDLLEKLGALPHMKRTSGTFYTVETHIIYSRELVVDDSIRVETQIVSYDRKRLHLFSTLYHGLHGFIVASGESMILHYVQNEQRVLPMPDAFFAGVAAMAREHALLPIPPAIGRGIRAIDLNE